MKDRALGTHKETVNHRVLWISLSLCVLGFFLIYLGTPATTSNPSKWDVIFCSLGGSLFAASILSTLWELFAKRAFASEMLCKVKLSSNVMQSGVMQITDNFRSPEMNWSELLKNTNSLDIFVCWAYTWRNTHKESLEGIRNNPKGLIRVLLPDPNHPSTIEHLSNSFSGYDEPIIKQKINEAIFFFKELDLIEGVPSRRIEIWCIDRDPKFSWYKMDHSSVFAFYAHRGKEKVPSIVCGEDGYLYDFARREFEFFFSENSNARRIYPENH